MKTILFANNKGGVGKTALSVILANQMAAEGDRRILLSDWDDQANMSRSLSESPLFSACDFYSWLQGKDSMPDSPSVVLTASDDLMRLNPRSLPKITSRYSSIAEKFDYHIIDIPPGASERMFLSIALADIIFVPLLPSHFSLQSATRFLQWLEDMDASHKFGGFVLNQVRPADRLADEIRGEINGQIVSEIKFRRYVENTLERGGALGWGKKSGANRAADAELKTAFQQIIRRI